MDLIQEDVGHGLLAQALNDMVVEDVVVLEAFPPEVLEVNGDDRVGVHTIIHEVVRVKSEKGRFPASSHS